MDEYLIRPARESEAEILTHLSFLSKASWGYPKEWLEAWRDELTVTPELISRSMAYVAEYRGMIVGFWCREAIESDQPTQGLLFIHPDHMSKGIGKKLFAAIKSDAIKRGIKSFIIEADPNALAFYLKLGAEKLYDRESKIIPGRMVPIVRFLL